MGKVPISFRLNRQCSAHGNRLSGALLSAFTTNLLVKPSSCRQRDRKQAHMGQQEPDHRTTSMLSENCSAVQANNSLRCTPTKLCAVHHVKSLCAASQQTHVQCLPTTPVQCVPMRPRNSITVLPIGQEPHRLTVHLKPLVADLVCQHVHPAPPRSRSL